MMGGALGLIMAGAGAATGVTFDGDVTGQARTKAEQAVTVSNTIVFAFNNGLSGVSDDGTEFKAGANINQGDAYVVQIELDNNSDESRTERLLIDFPEPLDVGVDADSTTGVEAVRRQTGEWLLNMDASTGQIVEITVASPDNVAPGFSKINAAISPEDFN